MNNAAELVKYSLSLHRLSLMRLFATCYTGSSELGFKVRPHVVLKFRNNKGSVLISVNSLNRAIIISTILLLEVIRMCYNSDVTFVNESFSLNKSFK